MKKYCLYVAFVATTPISVWADLQVDMYSDPGTFCYSEAQYDGDLRVILCGPTEMYGDDLSYFEDDCPQTWMEYLSGGFSGTCFLGTRNGYIVACDSPEENSLVCDYCGVPYNGQVIQDWTDVGSNRVRMTRVSYTTVLTDDIAVNTDWTCDVDYATTYEYGCAAGYCQSAGTGASMTCTRCPSSGGVYGTNGIGSTAITSCYIPSGTAFSDSAGTGIYTDNCYYSN